jgi:hypothetical protein
MLTRRSFLSLLGSTFVLPVVVPLLPSEEEMRRIGLLPPSKVYASAAPENWKYAKVGGNTWRYKTEPVGWQGVWPTQRIDENGLPYLYGDGIHDDTAAIRARMALGPVQLPPGTFLINNTFRLAGSVSGAGRDRTTLTYKPRKKRR